MQKALKCCAAVLGRVVFIGCGVQTALGILWMISAFAGLQGFGEGAVCAGRILLAAGAAYFFLASIGVKKRFFCLYGSLGLVTFPMIMQCHIDAGLQSVTASAMLLMMGGLVRAGRKSGGKYAVLRQAAAGAAAAAAAAAVAGAVILSPEGQSPGSIAASRFGWTTLVNAYSEWPQERRDRLGVLTVSNSSYEAAGIREVMAPYLRDTVGEEEAERIMREIAASAWRYDARKILKEVGWDTAGYMLSPVILQMQLQRRGYDSYSGRNYRQILRPNPRLGRRYIDFGCWWFWTGLLITGLLLLPRLRRIDYRRWALLFLPGCVMALLYAMGGAGQMDYKNTIYVLYVWLAAVFVTAERFV